MDEYVLDGNFTNAATEMFMTYANWHQEVGGSGLRSRLWKLTVCPNKGFEKLDFRFWFQISTSFVMPSYVSLDLSVNIPESCS